MMVHEFHCFLSMYFASSSLPIHLHPSGQAIGAMGLTGRSNADGEDLCRLLS